MKYTNVELFIKAKFDLGRLAQALRDNGLTQPYPIGQNGPYWKVSLLPKTLRQPTAENLDTLLNAIDKLVGEAKTDWLNAGKRFTVMGQALKDEEILPFEIDDRLRSRIDGAGAQLRTSVMRYDSFAANEFNDEIEQEREATIREIYEVFANVTREGGKSWADSVRTHIQQTKNSKLADHRDQIPMFHDRDQRWQELVDDPEWEPEGWGGGFKFLDPTSSRYYLPPAMIRALKTGGGMHLPIALRTPEKWSALDEPQAKCVKRFLECRIAMAQANADKDVQFPIYLSKANNENRIHPFVSHWKQAYDSYWKVLNT